MRLFILLGQFLYTLTLQYGVVGLGVGTFLESFGIPTAAVVIDLTAGILILSGRTTFLEALLISDLGLVLGSLASYYIGKAGAGIFERWHRHPPDEAERRFQVSNLIERYGEIAVLFGQLFGPARTWISYPAGALGMDVKKFTLYTAVGGAAYCAIVITISLYFTDFIRRNLEYIRRLSGLRLIIWVVAGAVLIYLARRLWLTRRRRLRAGRGTE